MDKKQTLQLVKNGHAIIQKYVQVTVNVAGVQALVKAFILDNSQVYDLFLLKRWMYQICAIEDHKAGILTIGVTKGLKQVVDGQETDLLANELVNTFEIKDLEINLADKKVYQLINKANNGKYHYNEVKDQCY